MGQKSLENRVAAVADDALRTRKYVTPLDVVIGLGWLHGRHVDNWRQGRIRHLDEVIPVDEYRMAEVLQCLRRWARDKGLTPSETDYVSSTRNRHPLTFTGRADPAVERDFRTHWLGADLTPRQQEKQRAAPDLVVVMPVKDWTCAECHETGDLLIMDDAGPLCMTCADLDHLVFLPSGDAALTRRAKKASRLSAVVVRWSRNRKRYERQGLLVEEPALETAEQQCLDDEDARMRRRERDRERRAEHDVEFQARFADGIVRLYPRCPQDRAQAIAAHAGLRGSGRVGRSAAGRSLDETAITLAVVASVRHQDTEYDDLLMSGVARADARDQIRDTIEEVLATWS